jgi:ubiquinone biosynthesis protein
MTNWDFLIGQAALEALLPEEYAHFSRPIAGALSVFIGNLPETEQSAILVDQAVLPPDAGAAERLGALARRCPSLHKLGQMLARDRRISAELRNQFQKLESLPPSVPIETIESILVQELGPLDSLAVKLATPAIAEASGAIVIGFHDEGGTRGENPRDGVFKILKPGIDDRLEQELGLFERVGSYLDQCCDDFALPHLDYQETFDQIRGKLRIETRLDLEQRNLALARAFFVQDAAS